MSTVPVVVRKMILCLVMLLFLYKWHDSVRFVMIEWLNSQLLWFYCLMHKVVHKLMVGQEIMFSSCQLIGSSCLLVLKVFCMKNRTIVCWLDLSNCLLTWPLKLKISSLQTLVPWPIWSFSHPIWTTLTLKTILSPLDILEIGPELLLTPFDSLQRSWISWCPGMLGF